MIRRFLAKLAMRYLEDDLCSLQVFDWKRAREIIEEAEVYDVKNLEGKAVIISREDHLIKFVRMAHV